MTFLTETDVEDDVDPEATAQEAGKVCVVAKCLAMASRAPRPLPP